MKPELQKLFEGVNGLSTEFLDKVSGLLESKVDAARTLAIQETEEAGHKERLALVEAHQAEIATLKESNLEEMAKIVDSFLNGVVEDWANKNAPAIDAQIKTEAAENLLSGLTGVLKEAGINFATDTDGQIAALTRRLAEAEQRANADSAELTQLKEAAVSQTREAVITAVCEGMVETKKETVLGLLEGIEFKNESEFTSRVRTFRNLVEGKKEDDFEDKVGNDDEKDKKPKNEGKKSKKEGDDEGDDDDDDDKDDTDKEVNESVRRQLEKYREQYGING